MSPLSEINYLAVLVVAVLGMGFGALWYGPLFGKKWMSLMGWTQEQIERMKQQGMAKSYVLNFIATLVMTWVLAGLNVLLQAVTFGQGAGVGFWAWLGFVAPIMLGSVLWESRRAQLYFLNVSYWLVMLVIMGGILAVWS